jgi:hypothetical protein
LYINVLIFHYLPLIFYVEAREVVRVYLSCNNFPFGAWLIVRNMRFSQLCSGIGRSRGPEKARLHHHKHEESRTNSGNAIE